MSKLNLPQKTNYKFPFSQSQSKVKHFGYSIGGLSPNCAHILVFLINSNCQLTVPLYERPLGKGHKKKKPLASGWRQAVARVWAHLFPFILLFTGIPNSPELASVCKQDATFDATPVYLMIAFGEFTIVTRLLLAILGQNVLTLVAFVTAKSILMQ